VIRLPQNFFQPSKLFFLIVLLVLVLLSFSSKLLFSGVYALDEVDKIQQQIDQLDELKKLSEAATTPLEAEVATLESRIRSAQTGINSAKVQATELATSIEEREEDLAYHYQLFANRIAESYRRIRSYNPLVLIFTSQSATTLTKNLAYQESAKVQDDRLIRSISEELKQLASDKKELEETELRLAALQVQLDEQADFFKGEIGKAKSYQAELSGKIAELSAKQQAILSARSGSYTTSVGDVPLADDFNASIAFKAQAPNNSFAVFSFGAYTHRNGMSQYGAKARAESGQSAEQILLAYYPGSRLEKNYNAMDQISVDGYGSISFEGQYLQGIYEMPASWHTEALKAQAIAARTYAIRYTDNGVRSICATESCQVFKNSPKGGDWQKAVDATKNWVLLDGSGNPISTQYASTHGGYTNFIGWDLDGSYSSGSWSTIAWENRANSPWFYKSWYRSGYSSSGANCGRSHPWLSQEDFSDILNAYIVRQNPQGADTERIQPVTINECQIGGGGGNPFSNAELRDLANKSGGAVTNVNSVSVSHNSNGQTSQVSFSTNRGSISMSGSDFKTIFNLRAPGYLRIPQSSFSFFNIEHKQ
jgi:peptidoglycan hydrolase-like amidase